MKLREWQNTDSEHTWIARNAVQSDWPVTLLLRVQYLEAAMSEREWKEAGGKYCIEVLAAAPDAVTPENKRHALECCGLTKETSPDALLEALVSYGIYAPLYSEITNNKSAGIQRARARMRELAGFTFGFAMDRAVNAIGNTGWDWIAGNIGA